MKEKKPHKDYSASSRHFAFSLAEMMVVLLIMTIVMAMTMPIISKRIKTRPSTAGGVSGLPIKAEGEYCDDPQDGKIDSNLAITADHSTMLVCMSEATVDGDCSNIGNRAVQYDTATGEMTYLQCQDVP